MIYARPNLNGNSAADFEIAADLFKDAQIHLERAIRNYAINVVHERNYQTGQVKSDREHDIDRIATLANMISIFQLLEIDIRQASGISNE